MPTQAGLADGLAQQGVGTLAALRRARGSRTVSKKRSSISAGLTKLRMSTVRVFSSAAVAEVLLREDDEAALLVFVALDQLFPGDRLALARADALELDRRLVVGVQLLALTLIH